MKKHEQLTKAQMLTQNEVKLILCYNPLSGNFMWRTRPSPKATLVRVGEIAGSIVRNSNGRAYKHIKIHGRSYLAHLLAFLYMRGYWPRDKIDHKDGNGLNNRWLNLRECNNSQNCANRGVNKNNKLGIKGVCYRNGKYTVSIDKDGRKIWLGIYNTPEAASRAYQEAAKKYFGEFASK